MTLPWRGRDFGEEYNIVLRELSHELVGLCMWPGNKNKVLVERVQNTSVRITEGGLAATVIPIEHVWREVTSQQRMGADEVVLGTNHWVGMGTIG